MNSKLVRGEMKLCKFAGRGNAYLCGALNIESVGLMHNVDINLRNYAIKTLAENGITLKRLARITCLTKPELRQIFFGCKNNLN